MRIEQITLRNVRLFGDDEQTLTFDGDKNITILLGNNGYGKSTILDAISIMLSPFIGVFPGNSLKNFKDTDVHIEDGDRLADSLYSRLSLRYGDTLYDITCYRKGMKNAQQSELKEI